MKKILLLSSLLLISFAGTLQAQKFGFCNANEIIASLPEVKQADSDLKAFQAQLSKRGQEMVKDLQEKAGILQDKQDKGTISPKDYQAQSEELKEEEAKIGEYEQEMYNSLAKKREDLYTPILDRVNAAMKQVAEENGYTLVFDSSTGSVLYGHESCDVTKLVKAKLNIPTQE